MAERLTSERSQGLLRFKIGSCRRRATMFRAAFRAREGLGVRRKLALTPGQPDKIVGEIREDLRREAAAVFDNAMARSHSWLVDHDYLLLRDRKIRRLVGDARRHQEQTLFKTIAAVAGPDRETWLSRLLAPIEDGGIRRLEWLGAVPSERRDRTQALKAQIENAAAFRYKRGRRIALGRCFEAGRLRARQQLGRARPAAASRRQRSLYPSSSSICNTIEICFLQPDATRASCSLDRGNEEIGLQLVSSASAGARPGSPCAFHRLPRRPRSSHGLHHG